jgi:hypothetical protein
VANPPQYRPRLTGNPANDEALRVAFNHIYELQGQIANLSTTTVAAAPTAISTFVETGGGGGGGGATGQIVTDFITLTGGGTQTVTYPAPSGTAILLIIVLKEDATGGTYPAWGSTFSTNTPTNINVSANAPTVLMFTADGSIWQYSSLAA